MMSLQLQRDHVQLQRNDKVVTNFSDVVAGCWFEALRRKRPVLIHLKYMASRPLQKGKGLAATSLGAVPPDKQKQKRVGVLFLLWYVLFGFPTSTSAQVLLDIRIWMW